MTPPYGFGTPSRSAADLCPLVKPLIQTRLEEIPLGEPLRLVRIERELWIQALEPDLQAPDDSSCLMMASVRMIATPTFCPHRRAISKL